MKLTIVIPVYNEEPIIIDTVKRVSLVLSKLPVGVQWDIVVVDNGSTDNTAGKLVSANLERVSLMRLDKKGKGLAVCSAAASSDSDFFGFIDADLSADPESIIPFFEMLKSGKADIVIGSRFADASLVHRDFFRTFTSKMFNILQRYILGLHFKDTQCGLKIMNRNGVDVLRKCVETGWFFDLEFLHLAIQKGLVIYEFPISWEEFRYYKQRKGKLEFMDGFYAVIAMFRIRNRSSRKI